MADWATVAEVGTAVGTLVLAAATFGATRSANRAARIAERAFEVRLRPVLVPSRLEDPAEKIMWGDQHWTRLLGGRASVEIGDAAVYLTMSLRNVGSGMAVIHGWRAEPSPGFVLELQPELLQHPELQTHPDLDEFRAIGGATSLASAARLDAASGQRRSAVVERVRPSTLSVDGRRPRSIGHPRRCRPCFLLVRRPRGRARARSPLSTIVLGPRVPARRPVDAFGSTA